MNLTDIRATSDLLSRLDDSDFTSFEDAASQLDLEPDERLFRENDEARRFFIITKGIVALEVAPPARPPTIVQTLGDGALLGLSWRLSPHRWMWTARAMTPTRLAVFDAASMRKALEQDCELDRHMWEVLATQASERLHHAWIQLLDLYGKS